MIAVLTFLLTLSVLVLVHEFGHFWVARRAGVTVHEFGLGFPPRIVSWRRGQTVYSLNGIPFGGFVKLEGEDAGTGPGSFRSAPIGKRAAILLAGVVMNLVLAVVVFTITLSTGVPAEVDPSNLPKHVSEVRLVVADVQSGSPAEASGVKVSDTLLAIDGAALTSAQNLRDALAKSRDAHLLTVEHRSVRRTVSITPATSSDGPRIGVAASTIATLRYPFPESIGRAVLLTGRLIGAVFGALGSFVRDLVVQHRVAADITGPIGIAVVSGRASAAGFVAVLQLLGALSVSLAVANALPLPALDGGRLLLTLVEGIRRKPLPERFETTFHTVGFYALLGLILVVSIKDVRQFDILGGIRSWFR